MSAPTRLPEEWALLAYLRMLTGEQPDDRFLDIRWMAPAGMRRRFIPAARIGAAARLILRLAPHHDVYVGVALRSSTSHGGRSAITTAHLLHVDCDRRTAANRLVSFHPASMLIASGTPGHLHAYWQLRQPAPGEQVATTNRRLALRLAADMRSADLTRILRPPGTFNHKHAPPARVTLLAHHPERRYALPELTAGLPDPPRRLPAQPRRLGPSDPLREIPAATYVRALTGCAPNATGKLLCPFHAEQTPSLQLYPDNTWFCFGCRQGGSIYDFAAHIWNITPRGQEFIVLRTRLAAMMAARAGV